MRNILSSAHVHTTFCDGKSTASDMARTAYEQGFVSPGVTSHAAQTFDPAHCIDPPCEEDYKKEIRRLKHDHVVRLSPDPEKGMWERIELK